MTEGLADCGTGQYPILSASPTVIHWLPLSHRLPLLVTGHGCLLRSLPLAVVNLKVKGDISDCSYVGAGLCAPQGVPQCATAELRASARFLRSSIQVQHAATFCSIMSLQIYLEIVIFVTSALEHQLCPNNQLCHLQMCKTVNVCMELCPQTP